jgi:ATP-dependent DNA ligase
MPRWLRVRDARRGYSIFLARSDRDISSGSIALSSRLRRLPATRLPPVFVTPMAAQVVKRLPEGPEWLYELKLDGIGRSS